MYIKRHVHNEIITRLSSKRAIVIYGPRQVGKTTLVTHIAQELGPKTAVVSGEDKDVKKALSSQNIEQLRSYIGDLNHLIIDEAQNINKIGLNIKLIVDHIKSIKIIATGSSSFELSNQIGEPLVGRKWQYMLYPISQLELEATEDHFQSRARLEQRLIYGSYPEVITTKDNSIKKEILKDIVNHHLFKDILTLEKIRKSQKLINLLQLLAFQIGHEVSLTELSNNLGINLRTVERYLDLLEKVFVIKQIRGFSQNLRKEVSKTSRYYFIDNGIRNAIINNFNLLDSRNDSGQLWENYLFVERTKKQSYKKISANTYFWRTYDKKEIDLVEEREGKLFGYEFKWGSKKGKEPKDWSEAYPNSTYKTINQDNYLDFIC